MGWAVNETKSRVVFSNRQKDLLKDKFITGKVTINKTEPYVAADEVRNSVQYKSEFISGQRILSVCLAFVKRRGTLPQTIMLQLKTKTEISNKK